MSTIVSCIFMIFTKIILFEKAKANYSVYLQVSSKPSSGSGATNYIILKGNLGYSPLTAINNFPNGTANPAILQDGQLAVIKDKFPKDYGYINTVTVGNYGDTLLMQSLNVFDNMRNLWSNMTFIYPIGYIQISSSTDFLYPVNGSWSDWLSWGGCSITCGSGTMVRQRTCTNPDPANGGLACNGSSTQWQACVNSTCPASSWSDWSSWSECSVTCDLGFQSRSRSCTDSNCDGNKYDFQICLNNFSCPIDGEWNVWSNWSTCSEPCGLNGTIQRTRECNNPFPSNGGVNCSGPSVDNQMCFNYSQNCQSTNTTDTFSTRFPQGSTETQSNNCSFVPDQNSLNVIFQLKFLWKFNNEYLVKFSKWWCGVFRCNSS